jgi:hypothetical protein
VKRKTEAKENPNMKVTLDLDGPVDTAKKYSKTFTLLGKKKERVARKLIKMVDSGMILIPVQITIAIGNEEFIREVLISSPVENSFRGQINQRNTPPPEAPEVFEVADGKEDAHGDDTGMMRTWYYTGVSSPEGQDIYGQCEAECLDNAIQFIRRKGIFPSSVHYKEFGQKPPTLSDRITKFFTRLRKKFRS